MIDKKVWFVTGAGRGMHARPYGSGADMSASSADAVRR
jgi:hypothetical protein